MYSLGICLAVVVSGSLAPLAEGFRERLDGNCRHVVFMPETPHEVYSLVVAFRIAVTGRKEIVGSGEGLIEELARLVCFGVVSQITPIGEGIVSYLHGAALSVLTLRSELSLKR